MSPARRRRPGKAQPSTRQTPTRGRLASLIGFQHRPRPTVRDLRILESALQKHYTPEGDTTEEITAIRAEITRRSAEQKFRAQAPAKQSDPGVARQPSIPKVSIEISTISLPALVGVLTAFMFFCLAAFISGSADAAAYVIAAMGGLTSAAGTLVALALRRLHGITGISLRMFRALNMFRNRV